MTKPNSNSAIIENLTSAVHLVDISNNGNFVILFLISCLHEKIQVTLNKEVSSNMGYIGHVDSKHQDDVELPFEKPRVVLNKVPLNKSRFFGLADIFNRCIEYYPFAMVANLLDQTFKDKNFEFEGNFNQIFEQTFQSLTNSTGREKGQFILPTEISKLVMSLANLSENASVFNPFAGFASFGIGLTENQFYIGQELDKMTWALAQLRLNAFSTIDFNFELVNSLLNWPKNQKFDAVITSPPFRMRIGEHNGVSNSPYREVEQFLLNEGPELLNPNGKLLCIVPNGFLVSSAKLDLKIRKKIVEQNLLETVISFPPGLLVHTNIAFSILVINKNKSNDDQINFIEAMGYIQKVGKYNFKIDSNRLINDLKIGYSSESHGFGMEQSPAYGENSVKKLTTSMIKNADWSLSGAHFDIDELEGTILNDVVDEALTYSQGQLQRKILKNSPLPIALLGFAVGRLKKSELSSKPVVLIGNLKNDPFDFTIEVDDLPSKDKLTNLRLVGEHCIMVALNGNELKPTVLSENNQSTFYISSSIFAFKLKKDINIEWFIYELHSKRVKDQMNSLRRGTGIPYLSKKDFLKIKIEIPSLQEQKLIVHEAKRIHIEINETVFQYQKKLIGFESQRDKEMQALQHTLRQYLNALKSNTSGTRKFIEKNEGDNINLNTIYSKNLNRTLGDHLNAAEGLVDSMSKLLKPKHESIQSEWKDYSLMILVGEALNRFKNPDIFKFQDDFDQEVLVNDHGFFSPMFQIIEEDFYVIFSNIIENAIKHGFKNRTSNNIVRTFITYEWETKLCVLEISNNGNPFPQGFDLERFKIRGEKTTDSNGEGIGGADIYKLINKYNGTLELINNADDAFPVKFILKFPYHWGGIEELQKQAKTYKNSEQI